MSIFKTKWIILKINKIDSSNQLYTIFTYDYWIIKCSKKRNSKEKNLDLWYLINSEIETKENSGIHKMRNIKIKWEFKTENKSFSEINWFLETLWYLLRNFPEWVSNYELFWILEYIIKLKHLSEIQIILSKLKIKNIFWELNLEDKNKTVSKILKFINSNNIETILKLVWVDEKVEEELKRCF